MEYSVKSPILGFEDTEVLKFETIDEMFATAKDASNEEISFTLANPYTLREYSFNVPLSTKTLLGMNEDSKVSVYNIVVVQNPLDNSYVNFLAPFIFNEDNKTVVQLVLNENQYPDFKMAQTIKSLLKKKEL